MKFSLLLFLNFLLFISVKSQVNESAYSKMLNASLEVEQFLNQYGISIEDLKNINGSPYYQNNFQLGKVFTNNDITARSVPMRYNIFADEIEINTSQDPNNQNLNTLIKSTNVFVKIGPDVFVYVKNLTNSEQSGYFNVVFEGEHFDLYKKSKVKYIEKRFAETPYQKDQPARFDRIDTFFLISKTGLFYELPTNRKRFTAVFNEYQKNIDTFVRDQRIDIKNKEDLIKVVKFFNEIL